MRRLLLACLLSLAGCATHETRPVVTIAPNQSGIETGPPRSHPPYNLIGGLDMAPDIPSGITLPIRRTIPLHNKEPRYFIPAAGTLQVVNLEKAAAYPGNLKENIAKWQTLLGASDSNQAATRTLLEKTQLSEIP